jgi:hypothetical protein
MKVLFSPIPDPKSRWTLFITGYSVQALALLIVINLNLLYPARFELPARYMITNLVPYEPPVPHTGREDRRAFPVSLPPRASEMGLRYQMLGAAMERAESGPQALLLRGQTRRRSPTKLRLQDRQPLRSEFWPSQNRITPKKEES